MRDQTPSGKYQGRKKIKTIKNNSEIYHIIADHVRASIFEKCIQFVDSQ